MMELLDEFEATATRLADEVRRLRAALEAIQEQAESHPDDLSISWVALTARKALGEEP